MYTLITSYDPSTSVNKIEQKLDEYRDALAIKDNLQGVELAAFKMQCDLKKREELKNLKEPLLIDQYAKYAAYVEKVI